MTIGERIAARRRELNMTQDELATKMGYKSRSTINKIEKGVNDITQSGVVKFAKCLDTTVAYIMGGDENSPAEPKLSEGEKELIQLFQLVPEEDQPMVLRMIRAAINKLQ